MTKQSRMGSYRVHTTEVDDTARGHQTVDLLTQLIRNACVNDGVSGSEATNVDALRDVLEHPGIDVEVYETAPGRSNLVARIQGSDASAPSLLLSGHTDVVPADPDGWRRDPFGGEVADGFVWGRGAIDMLNLTASMAVAVRSLAEDGFTPDGTLVFAAVADEEAGCDLGARWLVENQPDAVRTDYVVTEFGGVRIGDDGLGISVGVAEKGPHWITIDVAGTPGHGSAPWATDNALVNAARVVDRIATYTSPAIITAAWRRAIDAYGLPADLVAALKDPDAVDGAIELLTKDEPGFARQVHSCTHTTFAPTMLDAGVKTNVIPDHARLAVDIRVMPGVDQADVTVMLRDAIGDLWDRVHVTFNDPRSASESPVESPLWDVLQAAGRRLVPGSHSVPAMMGGFTDSYWYRKLGAVAYGAGLFSDRMPMDQVGGMFHGRDERIDVDSLTLDTELWRQVAQDLLAPTAHRH